MSSVGGGMHMAVKRSTPHEALGEIGGVDVVIAQTLTPWDLDIDALVVSVGRSGFGMLGSAVQSALLGYHLPSASSIASRVTPSTPFVDTIGPMDSGMPDASSLPVAEAAASVESVVSSDASSLQYLVFVTVRDGAADSSGEAPASVANAALASVSSLVEAAKVGAKRVGLPLLGTGAAGMASGEVAPRVLNALRQGLRARAAPGLQQVVLIAPDPEIADTLRTAWGALDQGVQLSMLADLPVDDPRLDLLGTRVYAEALAFVADNKKTATPLTMAINAPWGAGKTSVAKLLEHRLHTYLLRSRQPISCWFNAWHHDDAPNIVAALASKVARAADHERTLWRRILDPLPTRLLTPDGRRRRYLTTTLLSLIVGLAVLIGTGAFHSLTTGKVTASVLVTLLTAIVRQATTLRGTAADVGSLVRTPDAALLSGSLDEVRTDLGRLIHQATVRRADRKPGRPHRRLIVFIDDLERCQPERSIDVCETVSSLLSHEDVVVVLIGDMQTLATAAESKYKDLAPRYRAGMLSAAGGEVAASSFGELYLEKIIQFRFDLPTHNLSALAELAKRLEVDPGEEARVVPRGQRFAPKLRARLRDWRTQRSLIHSDGPTVSPEIQINADTDGQTLEQLEELRALLDRVEGPSLQDSYTAVADLVRPLPRDLKRLLNRIRFYLYLLDKKGLLTPSGPVGPQAVGKWALLAERWPDLAVAISATPELLSDMEVKSKTVQGFMSAMNDQVPGYSRSGELQRLLVAEPQLGVLATHLARLSASPTPRH
jgi:hypothetical protein